MELNKILIIMMVCVFLFGISSVCAGDVNDTVIAGEDTTQIEAVQSDDICAADDNQTVGQSNDEMIGEADVGTFTQLQNYIDTMSGDTLELDRDYRYDDGFDIFGIKIKKTMTLDGKGYTIDAKGARGFNVEAEKGVTIKNLTIKNAVANGNGGAIYFSDSGAVSNCKFIDNQAIGDGRHGGAVFFNFYGEVTDCTFVNNTDSAYGGALYINSGSIKNCNFTGNYDKKRGGAVCLGGTGEITNCNFVNNSAEWYGGAVCFWKNGKVTNCTFTGNNAGTGSAIYAHNDGFSKSLAISNSTFLNNRAICDDLDVTINENNIEIILMGHNNLLNAIYSNDAEVTLSNVTYWGADGITRTENSTIMPSGFAGEAGQNITVKGVVNGNILNENCLTDGDGKIVLRDIAGEYWIVVHHADDSYYTETEKIISKNMKFYVNVTETKTSSKKVNITAKSNIYNEFMPGELMFVLPDGTRINATYGADGTWWAAHAFDACGEFKVTASYVGLDNVTIGNATITVKSKTVLTANSIAASYNANRNLVITLKDTEGNTLSGQTLTVSLKGVKTYITDKNGQIKVPIKGLVPKAYTAKITFKENAFCLGSSMNVKVTVKKAKPKLTAKKKTFRKSQKVKKYSVTLKDATKKPIKNVKLTIKIKKKTFKAKTNAKGKAVFKIKKLTKKGTYKAKITFKENKYYLKVTKTVKIRIR